MNSKTHSPFRIPRYTIISFLYIIIGCCFNLFGQNLIESRQSSYYTYIYRITDKEAEKIYKNDLWQVDSTYFHSLVDSFPTDFEYDQKLAQGHYIKTFAQQNLQKVSITTVQDFEVFIFNNNTDLCLQIYDLHGNIIDNAEVRIRLKKLRFDHKTKSYIDRKSNQRGLLSVNFKGFTAYYNLSRQHNNSFIKRGFRKVIYGTPLRYIWMPVDFTVNLPVDGVKSVINGWATGTISKTKRFFVNLYRKVVCWFDEYYCDYSTSKFSDRYSGYVVFNQPRYKPGDTVKVKAFLLSKKRTPVNQNVILSLNNYEKNVDLAKISPYRPGGYIHQFVLHDSLELKLDKYYEVKFKLDDEKEYMTGSFKFEDYDLSNNNLTLRVDKDEHFRDEKFRMYVKGTNENDLNLLDARLEVLITPTAADKFFEKNVFIPDTLLFFKKALEAERDTEILIPDSLFPKANFQYNAWIRLLTSDNESTTENKEISYYFSSEKFETSLEKDSLIFRYSMNGQGKQKVVSIRAVDNFGNKTEIYRGLTPTAIDLNPYYSEYIIESDSLTKTLDISNERPLLQTFSDRTADSIYFRVNNPRNIPFMYNIYRRNTELTSGFKDSLTYKNQTKSKQDYFVSIRYLWGGKVQVDNYRIPLLDKKLNLKVTEPKLVYPGQKSRITISVSDVDGNPVEGVDLTAYSVTKKFDHSAPELPYLGKIRKSKHLINNFNFEDLNLNSHNGFNLNYESWKVLAGIDSIEYYKFRYPKNDIYTYNYITLDSITQFSPFLISKGQILPIHVVYVDNRPVYFSWSTNQRPYSFKIDEGFHKIKLRTTFSEIELDSIYFEKGSKKILSLDINSSNKNVHRTEAKNQLSTFEKRLLHKYIFPYRPNFGERYAYIKQGKDVQLLNPSSSYSSQNFAGPFASNLQFQLVNDYNLEFDHDPYFEYEFLPQILKMRSVKSERYPNYLSSYSSSESLDEEVLTEEKILILWQAYLDSKRHNNPNYNVPKTTSPGHGRLYFEFNMNDSTSINNPLNILLFKTDDHEFVRVYPGNATLIHDLQPGTYKLLFFYPDSKYQVEDSLTIRPNGLNYYRFENPLILQKDDFSIGVGKIIEESLFKNNGSQIGNTELNQIYNSYQRQFPFLGLGNTVKGHVYDQSGIPLPGVNVIVKGTNYGTQTDFDGFYSVKTPSGHNTLVFSFVGMITKETDLNNIRTIDVTMEEDRAHLDEVVVVAMGVSNQRSSIGYAVSTLAITDNINTSLSGKASGVQITNNNGGPGNSVSIKIRGASSFTFENTPLYIINGSIFTGNIEDLNQDLIENITVLEDSEATSIYGSRGANGVVLIDTKPGTFENMSNLYKGANYHDKFYQAAAESSSIRQDFSDYAFWQPTLKTDEEGIASFETVFPDDVTNWDTFYLAMNDERQAGQTNGSIRSYKPLLAQLALPRFMVETDTAYAIGKVLNYTPDSLEVKTSLEIDGKNIFTKNKFLKNSIIDTLLINAGSDSLTIKYALLTKDNYLDGEKRDIAVFRQGLEETQGIFNVLERDTTVTLSFDPKLGKVNLFARADILEVIEDEISQVIDYKYYCNEQIASKLKALLAEKTITEFRSKEFRQVGKINKLIRLLEKNQEKDGLWGWWENSSGSLWISLHVLEALGDAEKNGFKISIDKNKIAGLLAWELETSADDDERLRMLKILNLLKSNINFEYYIKSIERKNNLSLNNMLNIMDLKRLREIPFKLDTLSFYKHTSILGNIYYSDGKSKQEIYDNDIQNSIIAYRLIKEDSLQKDMLLSKIRNYFYEQRHRGQWTNTYESAQIIETIVPDLLLTKSDLTPARLTVRGGLNHTVQEFPWEIQIQPNESIELSKTGDFPVYFTAYQKFWNKRPTFKSNDFQVTTRFENSTDNVLSAGQQTTLITNVVVKKDADYVMINIPIPGGCSYLEKRRNFNNETHREYYKNQTTIFCDYLPAGEYTFEVDLISRYTGSYIVNPAKVEMMYFPTFNANDEIKRISIN